MLSASEVAAMLDVSAARVRELAAKGVLPAQKAGRAWLFREEDVAARLDRRPSPGRPPSRAGVESMPGSQEGQARCAVADLSLSFHAIYEACRRDFMCCPTVADIEAIDDQEEAAFRVAVSDFFLQQRQRALVAQGVY